MNKLEQIRNKKLSTQLSLITTIIAIIGLAIVPLLVRVTPVDNLLLSYNWYAGSEILFDMYSIFKSQVILCLGIISLLVIVVRQVKFKTYTLKDPVIVLILIFSVVTILSHFFSVSIALSNRGMNGRFENTWIWLAYASILTLVYGEEWTIEKLNKLVLGFVISNLILSIVGILQYFGIDPVFNDITKPFITSFKMGNLNYVADYTINYKVIVQTLYHYNYVGFYSALSIPMIMSFALYDKKIYHRLGYLILLALMFFNLLGSSARGGLVGVTATIPLFIILNRQLLFKNLKIFFALILITVVVFIGFEAYTDGFITSRLKNIFISVEAPNLLKSLSIIDDSINIEFDHGILQIDVISVSNDVWQTSYYYNDILIQPILHESNTYNYFNVESLKDIKFYISEYQNLYLFTVEMFNQGWYFGYDEKTLKYVNALGKFDAIVTPDTFGFDGRERLGSARGYIWSRSIPLIMKKPILGYGVDTFAVVFPQQDYIGKYNAYDTPNMIVDKAHNIYIQIAINSGIIALSAYTSLVGLALFKTGRNALSSDLKNQNVWISATFLSVFSYSIAAIFNDSTVQISSVFWIILGIAFSVVKFKYSKTIEPKS